MASPIIAAAAAGLGTDAPWRRAAPWAACPPRVPAYPLSASSPHYWGPVEHPVTGERGFCKNSLEPGGSIAQEWLAAQLAREVGVRVPEYRFGTLEGQPGPVGVSIISDVQHRNLVMLCPDRPDFTAYSAPIRRALREASGLIPFHAWVSATDLRDVHLVVVEERPDGFVFAAVDFHYSMTDAAPSYLPLGPPALSSIVPDWELIAATVARIEACSDARIAEIVHALPADVRRWDEGLGRAPDWPARCISVLQARRGLGRAAMELLRDRHASRLLLPLGYYGEVMPPPLPPPPPSGIG